MVQIDLEVASAACYILCGMSRACASVVEYIHVFIGIACLHIQLGTGGCSSPTAHFVWTLCGYIHERGMGVGRGQYRDTGGSAEANVLR